MLQSEVLKPEPTIAINGYVHTVQTGLITNGHLLESKLKSAQSNNTQSKANWYCRGQHIK